MLYSSKEESIFIVINFVKIFNTASGKSKTLENVLTKTNFVKDDKT